MLAITFYFISDKELSSLSARLAVIENHLEFKKAKKAEYAQISVWVKENSEIRDDLTMSMSNCSSLSEKIDSLREKTVGLAESSKQGAIDSIQRAATMSDSASVTLEAANKLVASDLKTLGKLLSQRINAYNEEFEGKNKILNEYYGILAQNLTDALGGVAGMNLVVCGEATNEVDVCGPVCGGAGCEGKCGTNVSACGGVMDAYWKVVNARKEFDDLYKKQESGFKKILTKLHGASVRLDGANKDVESLLKTTNTTLQNLNSKKNDVDVLIEKLVVFAENNEQKPKKISSVRIFEFELEIIKQLIFIDYFFYIKNFFYIKRHAKKP